jgi:hypothetical protein
MTGHSQRRQNADDLKVVLKELDLQEFVTKIFISELIKIRKEKNEPASG